jgi:predicted XRE-type DNA-binding protein
LNKQTTKGNVFVHLGYSAQEAAVHAMRLELAAEIERYIRTQQLTQQQAARFFRVTQPKISNILRGRLDGFSIDYLVRMASLAGRVPRLEFGRRSAKNNVRKSGGSRAIPA